MSPPDQSLCNIEHVGLYAANVRIEKVRAEADAIVLVFKSQWAIRLLLLAGPEPGLLQCWHTRDFTHFTVSYVQPVRGAKVQPI